MSETVDRKCHVGENHKSQTTSNSHWFHPAFVEEKHWHENGDNEAECYFEEPIKPKEKIFKKS